MLITLLLLFINILSINASKVRALIHSLIIWTAYAYMLVLTLSSFHILSYGFIVVAYLIFGIILLVRLLIHSDDTGRILSFIRQFVSTQFLGWKQSNIIVRLIVVVIFIWIIASGVIAAMAVPYNYDSISYHAPRICQWAQNKSVLYYASHDTRQNVSTVLCSYISVLAYILSFKHPGAMCVTQYATYVINTLLIWHICRRYGVKKEYQLIAVGLWLTMPIGFAEAITPMNDQLAAMWLLSFVIILESLIDRLETLDNKGILIETCTLAILIGYAYITKPSVCFAMVVMLIWYLVECIRAKISVKSVVSQCISAGAILLIIICPQLIMNYCMMGAISAKNVGQNQLVGTLQPNYLFINMMKNYLYNFAVKIGGASNEKSISVFLYSLAALFGVELDAEVISECGDSFSIVSLPAYSCDSAIEFTISVLALLALIVFVIRFKNINRHIRNMCLSLVISFFVFCMFLRWEISINRYMIGYYALLIIVTVVVLDRVIVTNLVKQIIVIVAALLVLVDVKGELGYLWKIHPVIPVKSSMTMYNDFIGEYEEVCDYINNKGIDEIGLISNECHNEYPIWLMLNSNITINHVNVREDNPSNKYEKMDYYPKVIIATFDQGTEIECHGNVYDLINSNSSWFVYETGL